MTYANGGGGHPPVMNIVDGYVTAAAGSLPLKIGPAATADTRR